MNEYENQNNQNYGYSENEKNSKLLKGIVIGGVIGGVLTLLDSSTRNSLKDTAVDLKNTSKNMFTEVKQNPTEVKDQMVSQFQQASNVLKEAIADAQQLYDRLNNDLFGKVTEVKDISKDALDTVMGFKGEVKQIGSKVAEAGSELKAAAPTGSGTSSTTDSTMNSGMSETYLGKASGALTGSTGLGGGTDSFNDTGMDATYETTGSDVTSVHNENTEYGYGNSSVSSESVDMSASDDSFESEKSGGLGYSNDKGKHTTGGQESPNHDEDEKY
ncbi:hypothetical protein DRW41_15960 [Neobacillus piezotolerans]|uniref:YtxH domain-containing protein n=1 Tax=Neobacillus piezotolerans TaxID=2259171 RepID=A0A3D8GNS5_9BACI|nr:hypothetical protein [Neobacillus piezotolerans]RDU36078.1 hypothetical protein DRW41_15960 [Neobacillus piezotolerans]